MKNLIPDPVKGNVLAAALAMGAVSFSLFAAEAPSVRRIFREPRVTRGETNIISIQPIDEASWLWHPDWKDETTVTTVLSDQAKTDAVIIGNGL